MSLRVNNQHDSGNHISARAMISLLALLLTLAGLLAVAMPAFAQTYSFAVPELRMQVYVQPDASARIVYDITFAVDPFGRPVDVVDIGTPNADYDLSNMSASIDEVPLSDIRVSEFVDPGVEVHLNGQSILPGESSTLHFEFTMPDMVYQDTTRDDYASLQITPTWFEDSFVQGTSHVWLVVHLLPEVQPDEVLYQDVPFTDKVIFEEHPVVAWEWQDARVTGPRVVGVSFPQRGMTFVVKQSLLDLTVKWLEDNPTARLILGAITFGLLAFAFFRFSGGTGITVFVLLGCGLIWLLATFPASQLLALPAAAVIVVLAEWGLTKRKPKYLPAIAQVEGGGIKRGLTAPEAAVLLELPLNKILLLIMFGLLEKGVATAVDNDPLKLEVAPDFATAGMGAKEGRKHRLQAAQELGIVLRSYEHAFIDALEKDPGQPVHKIDFSQPMKQLIVHTADRIKGFDLSDTQEYYRKIIAKAMREAQGIGDIPERERYLDRHLQWLLLDDRYPTVFVAPDYHYRPIWVRPFASSDRLAGSLPGAGSVKSGPGGRTSLGDVAASFAGWTENTMGRMADSIAPGALQVKGPGGLVNLGGVDRVTGDIFKALATSSGGSGGSSGGGCACACAGCACACACAGGGR